MLRSRFLWQLVASFGAVVLVSTLVFGFVTSSQIQRDTRENIRESLQVQAALLRRLFVPYLVADAAIPSDELQRVTRGMDNRVTIVDNRGVVLADNREAPGVMDNHADRPEILMAESHQVGVAERYSETLDQNMLYVALRVEEQGEPLGYVRVAVPLDRVDQQLASLGNRIFVSAVLIAGFCLILVFSLARRFTRPITEMMNTATRLARGEYHLRLPVHNDDEVGRLSGALNELARGTEERIAALTHGRNQLAAVLSGLSEGVIAVDIEQSVLHINDAAKQMLAVGNREAVGLPLWEIVRVSEIGRTVETCLVEHTTVNGNVELNGKHLDVSAVPLTGEEWGRAAGVVVVLQDITEMLHLEKVRSDFVANASHELKTPISAIRGLVETILDDPDMPSEILNQFAGRISSQAKRLDNIVQDLIHLSRFDRSVTELPGAAVDLGVLLRQVYESEMEDAKVYGKEFVLDICDEAVEVEGEEQALNQMVSNLVDNAFKYSGDNGRVILRLRKPGGMAVIEVEDDGTGIPAEEQQRIFERFYRVDRGRSRELGGTGLGLSIVKHIAQSHGGSVSVDSTVGKGTLFAVKIPLASPYL